MSAAELFWDFSDVRCSDLPVNSNVHHSLDAILSSKYHILYVSIGSLRSKLDDLELYVHRLHRRGIHIHIIVLAEINIRLETSKYTNLPDYNAYFSTNENGQGGVAIMIHKSLISGIIESKNGSINCLIAHIPQLNVNVGVLYRDPDEPIETLLLYYDRILRKKHKFILFSDTNIDLLCPNRQYIDKVSNHQFLILNKVDADSATRNDSCHNERHFTISDHILSNVTNYDYTLSIRKVCSDTKVIVLGFDNKKSKEIKFVAEKNEILYNTIDELKFNELFRKIELERIGTIDSLVANLNDCKRSSTIVRKRYSRHRDKPWLSNDSLNKSDRFEMRAEAMARKLNGLRGRKFWDALNEFMTNSKSNRSSIDAIRIETRLGRLQLEVEKTEIANIFNRYFVNIGRDLNSQIPELISPFSNWSISDIEFNMNSIEIISTTSEEVQEKIDEMKPNNNFHEFISAKALKSHSDALAPILAEQFNDCFRTGVYPRSLKTDRIVPSFKGLDPLELNNYRPIKIPQSLSKLMESIICDRIIEFCSENNIIDKNQYGFQKNSNAISAVVAIVDYLQVGLSNSSTSIGACLFIDLKKASDTIPHVLFMKKLYRIGVRGPLNALIKSYLLERRQFVDIDNVQSEEIVNPNAISIPQGSALGPLFLLLYVNDICKLKLHGKIVLCADDTAIVYMETDKFILKRHMECDFQLLMEWFTKNAFSLNIEKTKAMLFNTDDDLEINLMVRENPIEFVSNHKYLGVHLQNNLQWDIHINKTIREISAASVAVEKITKTGQVDEEVSFTIYKDKVCSRLSYMASVYGTFLTKKQLDDLQRAQDIAIKRIYSGDSKRKLLSVKQIIDYDLALLAFKVNNNFLKFNRLAIGTNCKNVLSVAENVFESLDPTIQNENDLDAFKKSLQDHLQSE